MLKNFTLSATGLALILLAIKTDMPFTSPVFIIGVVIIVLVVFVELFKWIKDSLS